MIKVPMVKCANPLCNELFPFRSNKKFCGNKCKNHFHNKAEAEKLNADDGQLRKIKKAEKQLKLLSEKTIALNIVTISAETLLLFDIPLDAATTVVINDETNLHIKWFGRYGISPTTPEATYFLIYTRDHEEHKNQN